MFSNLLSLMTEYIEFCIYKPFGWLQMTVLINDQHFCSCTHDTNEHPKTRRKTEWQDPELKHTLYQKFKPEIFWGTPIDCDQKYDFYKTWLAHNLNVLKSVALVSSPCISWIPERVWNKILEVWSMISSVMLFFRTEENWGSFGRYLCEDSLVGTG